MFANALFIVAVIVLAATTVLSTGVAMTRAGEHRIAQQYLAVGYERAETATRDALADALRTGRLDPRTLAPVPVISPLPSQCATSSSPCQFFSDATVALGAPTASQAANLESSAAVNEGRIAAKITVEITAADGTRLATRTETATLRTFALPPYVTIAGARDATFDDVSGGITEGDDGGLPSETPQSTCPASAPSAAPSTAPDETVVRVQYRDDANGACMDGSLWRGQSSPNPDGAAGGWSP